MNDHIAVAVVGCGYWGKNLVRNFHQLGRLRVICDVDQAQLEKLQQQYEGVDISTSYEEVLRRDDVEGIVIAAPAEQHYSLAKRALEMGKDVFVEKPLALKVSHAEELTEFARKNRPHPDGRALAAISSGDHKAEIPDSRRRLGKFNTSISSRLNFGKLRTEENILWSFAPHDISAILHLLGEEPTSVAAHGGNYLNANVADVTLTELHVCQRRDGAHLRQLAAPVQGAEAGGRRRSSNGRI